MNTTLHLVPCKASENSHPSVSLCVDASFTHCSFLKFDTKLGLPNVTEVTFLDFARKIPFGPFWANLGPKMPFLA